MVSRQRAYQSRQVAEGKCSRGDGNALYSSDLCASCWEAYKDRRRGRLGLKPWKEGRPGRPPKGAQ